MDFRIEPLQAPNQAPNQTPPHALPRRVEPVHPTRPIRPTADPRDTIAFSDYLIKSNLGEPTTTFAKGPRPESRTNQRPEARPAESTPPRSRPGVPKLGDVSPVEKEQSILQYHATLRFERTLNLGLIVDLIV
jgi:hypothetical protein